MSFALAERLARSFEIGTAQMTMFVEQRLNTNNTKFWDSLPKDQEICCFNGQEENIGTG